MTNSFENQPQENDFISNSTFIQEQSTLNFSEQQNSIKDEENIQIPKSEEEKEKEYKWYHFYKSEYYQQWFNIDTNDILKRMVWGIYPFKGNFFDQIGDNQDLYGPLWISLTVVFLTFFSGSLGGMVSGTYEYIKLSVITGTVLVYLILVPIILYLVLYFALKIKQPLTKYFCLFGYSYTSYLITIPLCAIPFIFVQIPLICIGCVFQSLMVLKNLFQLMYSEQKLRFIIITLIVLLIINIGVAGILIYCVWP